MKTILPIAMVIPFTMFITSEKLNPEFTFKYFAEKNVRQMVVFACWRESDVFEFVKHIMNANSRMSYCRTQNYVNMDTILKIDHYKLGIVLDMDCPESDLILNQFSDAKLLFNDSYVWLTVTKNSVLPVTSLRGLPLRLDTELAVALTSNKDTYMLYDVYNPSHRHGGTFNVTAMGFWSEESGLNNYLTQYKYKRRQNLHGLMLNFSTLLANKPEPDLETYLISRENPHIDSMSRFHYELVLYLRDIYNFKINLKLDQTWGYSINGTYTGIVGDMLKGLVDASACHFQQRPERIGLIEYTVPTYGLKPHMFFLHPAKSAMRNQFLKPLDTDVWWLALTFSIVLWSLLLVAFKIENYYKSNRDQPSHPTPVVDSAVTIIAAISQQGSSIEPQLYSGRIMFLTLFVWLLMMFQFYSASIVGSLLAPRTRFINTIMDLANSDLDCGFEDVPYMRYSVIFRTDAPYIQLQKRKFHAGRKRKNWDNHVDGMREVSKGGYAFSSEVGSAYYTIEKTFTQEQICSVAEVPLIEPQYVSLITSYRSPFKKMMIYGLRQIVEHGIMDHSIKIWTHRRPECPESFQSRPLPVGLMELGPAMFLITAGLTVAVIIMALENLQISLTRRKVTHDEVEVIYSEANSSMSSDVSKS